MRGSFLSLLLCFFGAFTGFQAQPLLGQESVSPKNSDTPAFHIVVLAGQHAANILKTRSAVQPVVELRDSENHPVIGAEVTFEGPDSEPGVVFSNGDRWQSLVSEMDGRVAVSDMQPVGTGAFQISVNATYDGHFAYATIDQTNFATATAAAANSRAFPASTVATDTGTPKTGMSNRTKFAIFGGIAAAVGIALAVGLTRKSSSSTGTISAGAPTVGAPH